MNRTKYRVNVQSTPGWRYDHDRQNICDVKAASLGGKDTGGGCFVYGQTTFPADTDFTFESALKAYKFIDWLKATYTDKEISHDLEVEHV